MAANAQIFMNAQAAAQLAVLPKFSNVFKEDNFTPSQWLQKVLNHKNGAAWTDAQTITHVKNAFRGEVIDWFDSLKAFDINTQNWNEVKTAFESDFRTTPSMTTMVSQIPEIKQKQEDSVIQYFSKALKTIKEFENSINPMEFVIPDFLLPPDQLQAYVALPQLTRVAMNTHMRKHVAKETMNKISTMLITAGLKTEIRMEILKSNNLTLLQIKEKAIKYEDLMKDKIMTEEEPIKEKITVIDKQTKIQSPKPTCKYCKKKGHEIHNCWTLKNTQHQKETTRKQRETPNKQKDADILPIFISKNW